MHPEFPLDNNIVHLNHAGVAPWPRRTVKAVTRFATENMTNSTLHCAHWLEIEDELREQLRWLINAESKDDIGLLKSTSEALSVVAYGIDWQPGENVVTSKQEFPSNRIVWESLRDRFGVDVRVANLEAAITPEEALLQRCDSNTRLLAVSSVQYATGLRMDLERLGKYCQDHDVMLCVDAIQSLGVVPFDVRTISADFVTADGHKWMLGPEGVALFYCRPRRRDELRLNQFGWHMVQHRGDYERMDWAPAQDARRFECGSPNSTGIHALHASLSLIQEVGIRNIFHMVSAKVEYLIEKIECLYLKCLTPTEPSRRAGIITFQHPTRNNQDIFRQLQQCGVLCAHRAGGVRFSPHFYTPDTSLRRAVGLLEESILS